MFKLCPFGAIECKEKGCRLWVRLGPDAETDYDCAFVIMAEALNELAMSVTDVRDSYVRGE